MLDHTNIQEENNNFNAFELLINSEGPPDPNYVFDYKVLRKAEYDKLNQDEMRFDDLVNGTTTWQDAIIAIKAKYPKPTKG